LLLLPAAAVCWLGPAGVSPRRRAAAVGALVAAAALAVLPCALRNYVVGRDIVPVSANGGVNLYIGNNPHANGTFRAPAGWDAKLESRSQAYAAAKAGRPLKPSAASAYFTRRTLRFVVADPGGYLRLVGRRARLLVNAYDIPNHGDFYFFRARSALLRLLPFTWGVVLPWALVGAFASWRECAWRPALWFIAIYGFSIVGMFFVTGRYRFPVFPFLAVLAVAGAAAVVRWIRRGPRWRLPPAAALLAGGYTAAYLPPPADVVVPASYSWHHLGEAYAGAGDDRSAARAYEKAVALAPGDAYSWNNLGLAYMRQGKLAAAEEALERARALAPANVETLNNYCALLLVQGRTDEAAAYIARAVAAEPANAAARVNWGVVQLVRGDLDGAERTLRFALTLDPDFAKAYFNLGLVYEARGDRARAAAAFRAGLRLEPRNAAAREHLAALEGRL
jgi:Tfp pilus assembly protein PilF